MTRLLEIWHQMELLIARICKISSGSRNDHYIPFDNINATRNMHIKIFLFPRNLLCYAPNFIPDSYLFTI